MSVIQERPAIVPLQQACAAVGINRSTWYLRKKSRTPTLPDRRSRKNAPQPRALTQREQSEVITTLNSERFYDQTPAEAYNTLLEEGQYLCSVSTMHRLLRSAGQNGDRRQQKQRESQPVPRLKAVRANDVWTWDVTKLPLRVRGVYLSLYVVMDLYSRYIVAWMVSRKENSVLAQQLIREAHERYNISAPLTLHQDRGAPMIAHSYLDLLGELSITASHSRPRVSNDNAMSESQFKTMKYQPDYPRRFDSIAHAQQWCDDYVKWYNFHHHHSALEGFKPVQVFTGEYMAVAGIRQQALDEQYAAYPARFVRGRPVVKLPPSEVYINPVMTEDGTPDPLATVNFPTLKRCISTLS